ncbi:uncharacterized protein LOC133796448 [Humulus lupulus]|uniref:uncharacterized protein LOC133796448 n=1 Tax=Humulus lupulus TaxID=3486 RepID=UPI002B40CE98|nr:uncharacterized protein LOC133796448 [Humulus lupulus]
MALLLVPKHRTLANPSLIHLFSTSSSSNSVDKDDQKDQSKSSTSESSFSSYFSDVKASLRQKQQSTSPPQPRNLTFPHPPQSSANPSKVSSLEEIRKNLSEFRRRSGVPPSMGLNSAPSPSSSGGSSNNSFQELLSRNVLGKAEGANAEQIGGGGGGGGISFEAIRLHLKKLRAPVNGQQDGSNRRESTSFTSFKNNLRLKPSDSPQRTTVIGGTDTLPASVFGKDIREKKDGDRSKATRTEFLRTYPPEVLGGMLKELRPEVKEGAWFSIKELNERMIKIREFEDTKLESNIKGINFKDLRESLEKVKCSEDEKTKKNSISLERLDILGQLGRTPNFMAQPPQEHLVEKYFHPDNMSAAEKMKLELAKVRDEFKLSESDCGSARVQVAQLTTKIKHLSTTLHKKDKHSRKGLTAMVQRRKKLLKYLRRTDWDSYCFVLSKLGLRDNPDYKH